MNKMNIKLGIIYHIDDLILHNKVNYIEYIKVETFDDIVVTKKPTLFIGWSLFKKKYSNVNILNKIYSDNIFWTFSFDEKKSDYVYDLDKFTKNDIFNIFKPYKYIILSPIFNNKLKNITDYIEYFDNCDINNVYVSKSMELSILCNNVIYKVNLREINFYHFEYKTLLKFLKNKYNNFYYDKNGELEEKYLKYFHGLDLNIVKKYFVLFNKVILY
jgi:hypothetical protein